MPNMVGEEVNFVCESDGTPKLINRDVVDYIWVRPEDTAVLEMDPYSAGAIRSYLENSGCKCKKHEEDDKIRIKS